MTKFLSISQLQMEDRVIPMSTNPKEQGKTFTVTDLHPCNMNSSREYKTVAVTLWDCDPKEGRYGKEHTSHTTMFQVVERYLDR